MYLSPPPQDFVNTNNSLPTILCVSGRRKKITLGSISTDAVFAVCTSLHPPYSFHPLPYKARPALIFDRQHSQDSSGSQGRTGCTL